MSKKIKYFSFILFLLIFSYFIFPYFVNIEIQKIPNSIIVYDSNNYEIGEIINDSKYRHIEKNIVYYPDFLKNSLITIEDRRFYYHSGVDYIGIIRAFKNNIFSNNKQGASNIENQIIRNNFWLNEKRNYNLKIKEFVYSLALNKKYSKDEILEMYLNNINFGYLNYGFESASRFYYNKSINNLSKAEIIGLITIIKNSNKYNPITNLSNFNKRFKILVNYLYEKNIISKNEKIEILDEKLTFTKGKKDTLPYITDFLKKDKTISSLNTPNIYTTIDYNLTKNIEELSQISIKSLAWKNVSDYSIVLIDKKTMDLKVMIGGNDYYKKNGQVNSALALRQPGSALKPFIYLLAFRDLKKTSSSTILDLPVSYKTSDGNLYEPKNYSLTYAGEVSFAEALSQSINIPAVKILNEIGITKFMGFLKTIGINSINKDADYYGLSLALGSAEVNLYELTRAYGIFAKSGEFCQINFIKDQKQDCKKIIDKKYTKMIEEILTNRYFKLAGFPINSNLDFPDREVFVKTGTSRNFRDNWSIGYTNDYIIGVWVGNKDGSEMKGVSGASGAGDIFKKIVYLLDNNTKTTNIVSLPKEVNNYVKIISPLDKSVFKIDNSIPLETQKIKLNFSSNFDYDKVIWYFNSEIFKEDFLSLPNLKDKNIIKIELFKNDILIGKDEVVIEKLER